MVFTEAGFEGMNMGVNQTGKNGLTAEIDDLGARTAFRGQNGGTRTDCRDVPIFNRDAFGNMEGRNPR